MIVDPEQYISNGLKVVADLEKQGNMPAALKACEELLRVNPYHHKVQKYIERLQETIIKQNEQKVDKDIDATMHLWDEHRYQEIAAIYTRLYQFAPQHERLRKMIAKLQESMTDAQKSAHDDFVTQACAAISGLIDEKKWTDAMQASNELLARIPSNEKAEKLLIKAKDGYVDEQLEKNRHIVDGTDFERSAQLYQQLLAIHPTHSRTKSLMQRTQAQMGEKKVLASKIQLNESLTRMKDLFKANEYEKVIQSCDEILQVDAKNITAKIFREKAAATLEKECAVLELRNIKALAPQIDADRKQHPDKYISV